MGNRASKTMHRTPPIKVFIGSTNVFADLGLPNSDEKFLKRIKRDSPAYQ